VKLNETIKKTKGINKEDIKKLRNYIEASSNLLTYFNDIFAFKIESINRILFNSVISYCISPLLLGTLFFNNKQKISMYVAIFALRQIWQHT